MCYYELNLLEDKVLINLENVSSICLGKDETNRNRLTIWLDDGSYLSYTDEITIADAEKAYHDIKYNILEL